MDGAVTQSSYIYAETSEVNFAPRHTCTEHPQFLDEHVIQTGVGRTLWGDHVIQTGVGRTCGENMLFRQVWGEHVGRTCYSDRCGENMLFRQVWGEHVGRTCYSDRSVLFDERLFSDFF